MSNEIENDLNLIKLELERVKDVFKITAAKLMVANQTVHELLKGHIDLRAALAIAQTDKAGLEDFVKSLLNPPEETPAAQEAAAPETCAVQNDCANDVAVDANTVPA